MPGASRLGYRGPERRGARSRIDRYLGFHGHFLITFGVMWLMIAFAIASGIEGTLRPEEPLPHLLLPLWVRTAFWSIGGGVALICAVTVAPRFQRLGFAFLALPVLQRLFSYVIAQTVHWLQELPVDFWEMVPGNFGYPGVPDSWPGAVFWSAMFYAIYRAEKVREDQTPLYLDRRRHPNIGGQ